MGWTRKKKTLGATERNEDARAAWSEQRMHLDARKLVVIDACGSHIGLTPLYARAPRGKRVYGSVPRNRGKNMTLIAALTWSGMSEAMDTLGSPTTVVFERYIEEVLAPSLIAGQIVLMDNLAAHKGQKVERLIKERGCQLLFLPGYSPDFSPIEEAKSCAENMSAASWGSYTGGAARSHCWGTPHDHRTGRTRLVWPLRV